MVQALGDELVIPSRAVLLGEQQQVAGIVHPCGQAARLEQHEREKRVHGW